MTMALKTVSDYIEMSHRYDDFSRDDLEAMRQQSERVISTATGRNQIISALEQAISAKLLNQKFGLHYAVADITENGSVAFSANEPAIISHRTVPDIVRTSESFDTDCELRL